MSVHPVIDRNRCEGKAVCVEVCPTHVFEVRQLSPAERGRLSLGGRIRWFMHGGRQSVAVRAEDCLGCARCVAECPEEAIHLEGVA